MQTSTTFQPVSFFQNGVTSFNFLPFRFQKLENQRVLLTNLVGEYLIVTQDEYHDFVSKKLNRGGSLYNSLKQRHFLYDDSSH